MAIKLTKTETMICACSMLGHSVNELSELFHVHPKQVCRHMSNIYKKLGVSNRVELMAKEILRLNNEIRLMEMERDER